MADDATESDHDCPDCAVAMGRVAFGLRGGLEAAQAPFVRTPDRKAGLLGRLGLQEEKPVSAYCCPECGLVRLYADLEA